MLSKLLYICIISYVSVTQHEQGYQLTITREITPKYIVTLFILSNCADSRNKLEFIYIFYLDICKCYNAQLLCSCWNLGEQFSSYIGLCQTPKE